jgi:hypothetical protein
MIVGCGLSADSSPVNAKRTPTLMNMFRTIVVLIGTLSPFLFPAELIPGSYGPGKRGRIQRGKSSA